MSPQVAQALRSGGASLVAAVAPAVDYLTPFLADLNGYSEASMFTTKDGTKVFADAGITPIANGNNIYRLIDLTPRGKISEQAASARQPVWTGGKGVWAGTGSLPDANGDVMRLTVPGTSSSIKTYFASFTPTGSAAGYLFGANSGNNAGLGAWIPNGEFDWFCGSYVVAPAGSFPVATRSTIIITSNGPGNVCNIYANGILVATNIPGGTAYNSMSIGSDGNGSSEYLSAGVDGFGYVEGILTGAPASIGLPATGQIARGHLALANL